MTQSKNIAWYLPKLNYKKWIKKVLQLLKPNGILITYHEYITPNSDPVNLQTIQYRFLVVGILYLPFLKDRQILKKKGKIFGKERRTRKTKCLFWFFYSWGQTALDLRPSSSAPKGGRKEGTKRKKLIPLSPFIKKKKLFNYYMF